jgi:hypothetical protein
MTLADPTKAIKALWEPFMQGGPEDFEESIVRLEGASESPF